MYGGGFAAGSRDPFPGLVYDNIGAFFAQRGILIAIADYRLAPESTYPTPVEDIRNAIRFTLTSPHVDVTGSGGDVNQVYLLGHSAGGAHVATLFLNDDILTNQDRALLKGAIIMGAMYGSAPHLTMYYGEPAEDIDKKCPLGLLNRKSTDKVSYLSATSRLASKHLDQLIRLLPHKLFLLKSEKDDPVFLQWDQTFQNALHEKGITDYHTHTMKGHNHISPEVSLFSGEGEEWGEEVVRWIKA